MILVLAEKPSVGKDIGRVLNCDKSGNGFVEGSKYIVTWALGHLVTLADPESYDAKYAQWILEDLPIIPKNMKTEVIKKTRKQFNVVKELLHRKDVTEIVIATDAGREGELVARWIIEKANVKKPLKRLWISSVTDKAIKDGFNNLKDGRLYNNLYASALARSEADWIVGINATRALTSKYNAQLSCGRVQTPTLAMIAALEDEIRNFKPVTYYGIQVYANGFKFTWQGTNNDTRIFSKDMADKIINSIKNKKLEIENISRVKVRTNAPLLYDLTELQRDAYNIYDFSPKETLSIMQSLYERHKVLTYPRTDSRYLTNDIVDTLKDRVRACSVGPYAKIASKIISNPIKVSKNFVNNSKVSDHHAIIPTEERVNLNILSDRERKIYDLVVKRFLAVLSKPFEFEKITVFGKINNEKLISKGRIVLSMGWKEVYGNYEDEEVLDDYPLNELNNLKKEIVVNSIKLTTGETTPPNPFTEATLLSAMENPLRFMKDADKDLKKTIGETGGLGTVATRADIIDKLFNSYLIEKKGKYIYTTSKGRQLLDLAPIDLKSPTLTAKWEQQLTDIAQGKLSKNKFIDRMIGYTHEIVKEIKNSDKKFVHDNEVREKCPECGSYLLEVKGKKGIIHVCQNRECTYKKGVAQITNARCPECRKKLELRGEGEGRIFICKCGFREKLTSFNKRKEEEKTSISNKEVAKYMAKQSKKQDKGINTALADALAKLKANIEK